MTSKSTSIFKKFPGTFWTANSMEIFERWAWYGVFGVLALYLTGSTDEGALGFTQTQKGNIMGVVTAILYLLPLITGAIADRFGYKKVLLLAYVILSTGYFMMGSFTSYSAVFFTFLYVALGAALFKPVISATVSKTTTDETSSIGFGIFYMMVNIGGFVGPFCASKLRTSETFGWDWVFYMATFIISLNFILLLVFYKEPGGEKKGDFLDYFRIIGTFLSSIVIFLSGFVVFLAIYLVESPLAIASKRYNRACFRFADWVKSLPIGDSNKEIFTNITTIFKDSSFVIFLLLIVGFWTMFNQIFYTLPNFIDQWVDTTVIYNNIGPLAALVGTKEGTIAAEMMINLDAGAIIVFQMLISYIVMRFKPLSAMMGGILVCAIGVGLSFITSNGIFVILGIFIFALGEMASSPKFTEYIGKIAPKDKVALYMGCSFLPVAGGNLAAGFLSGKVYGSVSDKIMLLKQEVSARGLQIREIGSGFSQNDYIKEAATKMGLDERGLTDLLWNKYHPEKIWMIFTAIGLLTLVGLFLYDRFILAEKR